MAEPTNTQNLFERRWGIALVCPDGGVAVSHTCCRGGGGTGTSASGVGTCAVSWIGFPQFGQKLLSSLNSCPQCLQYLFAMIPSRPIVTIPLQRVASILTRSRL